MTALDTYIAPAGARGGWWRPLFGLIVIIGFWVVGAIAVVLAWVLVEMANGLDPNVTLAALGTPDGGGVAVTFLMLLTFVGVWLGCWLVTEALHAQPFATLFSPERRVRLGELATGLLLAVIFSGISLVPAMLIAGTPAPAQPVANWALLLAPILVAVAIQATAEELIFRGYLLQQLALRFRSPLVWGALPALVFGLLHYYNVEDPVHGLYYVAITCLAGMIFAALVWRTGSLWMATGMHIGVNLLTLAGVGAEGIVTGTQLWVYPKEAIGILLPIDLATSALIFAFVVSPLGRVLGDPATART